MFDADAMHEIIKLLVLRHDKEMFPVVADGHL
jgi:hypothetical protein